MTEQFRHRRFPTNYPVKVLSDGGAYTGKVIDVNQGGARLTGLSHLKRGDQIFVQVLTERVPAVVCWQGADRTGVSFPTFLAPRLVDTIRQATRASTPRGFSSVGLREMR